MAHDFSYVTTTCDNRHIVMSKTTDAVYAIVAGVSRANWILLSKEDIAKLEPEVQEKMKDFILKGV